MRMICLISLALLVSGCAPAAKTSAPEIDNAMVADLNPNATSAVEEYDKLLKSQGIETDAMAGLHGNDETAGPEDQNSPAPTQARASNGRKSVSLERCWQDYCPCQETGVTDRILCRNMRGGVAVDDDLMASGAAQRDGRAYMREWNRNNPDMQVPQQ